jgi:hypothetical protein
MPFKSEKQRRWMWANEPEMAAKWEEEEKNESHCNVDEEWQSGENLVSNIDHAEISSGHSPHKGLEILQISESQLRKIIREEIFLTEATSLEKSLSDGLKSAIDSSKFWEMPHAENDVDLVDKATFSTPAVEVLMDALNNAANLLGSDLYFILSVTDDETYTLAPNDTFGGYPNNWLMRGQYRGPEKGKHIVWLEFRPVSDDYDMNDLSSSELSKIISRTINHELVHYNQLKKQAESKGISEEEAWEELQKDPHQLTKSGNYGDYLSLHNEIDAFAQEAAEELLDKYEPDDALEMLRRNDREAMGIVGEYRRHLKSDSNAIKKFLSTVYSQIERMKTQSRAHST